MQQPAWAERTSRRKGFAAMIYKNTPKPQHSWPGTITPGSQHVVMHKTPNVNCPACTCTNCNVCECFGCPDNAKQSIHLTSESTRPCSFQLRSYGTSPDHTHVGVHAAPGLTHAPGSAVGAIRTPNKQRTCTRAHPVQISSLTFAHPAESQPTQQNTQALWSGISWAAAPCRRPSHAKLLPPALLHNHHTVELHSAASPSPPAAALACSDLLPSMLSVSRGYSHSRLCCTHTSFTHRQNLHSHLLHPNRAYCHMHFPPHAVRPTVRHPQKQPPLLHAQAPSAGTAQTLTTAASFLTALRLLLPPHHQPLPLLQQPLQPAQSSQIPQS
jgi:hypothetical protein